MLERDPDLGSGLAPAEFSVALRYAIARVERYPRGRWNVPLPDFPVAGSLGLLLLDGLLVRRVTVEERTTAELLGPGDLIQPWVQGPDSLIATEACWRVERDLRVAVLDRAFTARMAPWPEIAAAVVCRVILRVRSLSFQLSVCHMRRADERLLVTLWHFADRWGRVTPHGVEIRLPLTHSLLALVIGAHRPTVTIAARRLAEAGVLERRSRSGWLLLGKPPIELRQLHEEAAAFSGPLGRPT